MVNNYLHLDVFTDITLFLLSDMVLVINSDRMRLIEDPERHLNTDGNRNLHKILKILGYSELYPPQEFALSKGVAEGKNLLIVTPTASGKTLTAMIATISVLQRGLKVIYLTPLRALASEKYHDFKLFEKHPLIGKQVKVSKRGLQFTRKRII